jgi:hypothetical protein
VQDGAVAHYQNTVDNLLLEYSSSTESALATRTASFIEAITQARRKCVDGTNTDAQVRIALTEALENIRTTFGASLTHAQKSLTDAHEKSLAVRDKALAEAGERRASVVEMAADALRDVWNR